MKGNTEDAVREGAHALFYPHGLGHMMGLDVHDMENLGEIWVGYNGQPKSTQFGRKSQRLAIPLEPGFVHTVEPGIYFIPELIDMWKAEKKFTDFINYDVVETYKDFGGIRNEEDYLITETGARRLGKKIPLTPDIYLLSVLIRVICGENDFNHPNRIKVILSFHTTSSKHTPSFF